MAYFGYFGDRGAGDALLQDEDEDDCSQGQEDEVAGFPPGTPKPGGYWCAGGVCHGCASRPVLVLASADAFLALADAFLVLVVVFLVLVVLGHPVTLMVVFVLMVAPSWAVKVTGIVSFSLQKLPLA